MPRSVTGGLIRPVVTTGPTHSICKNQSRKSEPRQQRPLNAQRHVPHAPLRTGTLSSVTSAPSQSPDVAFIRRTPFPRAPQYFPQIISRKISNT